jgi:hypothetical protein
MNWKKMIRTSIWCAFLIFLGVVVAACGGSGTDVTPTVQPRVSVTWPDQVRSVEGPASALSFRVILSRLVDGSQQEVHRQVFNRGSQSEAHTVEYTLMTQVVPGEFVFRFEFYSQADAEGSLVGAGAATAQVSATGVVALDLTVPSNVATVAVVPGQSLDLGEERRLLVEVRNAADQVLVIEPNLISWESQDATLVSFTDGIATAHAATTGVGVRASVDEVTSDFTDVQVLSPAPSARFVAGPVGFWPQTLSPNGRYVSGTVHLGGPGRVPARWDVDTGTVLTFESLGVSSSWHTLVADTGTMVAYAPEHKGHLFSGNGPMFEIGVSLATRTVPQSISADGTTVVGFYDGPSNGRAFTWSHGSGGLRILDSGDLADVAFSQVRISADKHAIAAIVAGASDRIVLHKGGTSTIHQTGEVTGLAVAGGASGAAISTAVEPHRGIFVNGGVTTLAIPAGMTEYETRAITMDGSVILGKGWDEHANERAFVWVDGVPTLASAYVESIFSYQVQADTRFRLMSGDARTFWIEMTNGSEGILLLR